MKSSHSITLTATALALIAACNSDSLLNAPRPREPRPPSSTLQPTIRLVVIDSTNLPFAGTAAERAAGHYIFEIRDSVPVIAPGDYLAGRQGGLFLGRVVSVSQSGERLIVELMAAAWRDVLQPFKVHIPFTPGAGSAMSPYGLVRWGPWHVVQANPRANGPMSPTRPLAAMPFRTPSGAPANADNFDPVGFLLDNFNLCAASGVVTGCANITAKVLNATFSLTGGVDVGADIDVFHLTLDAHATINEQLNSALDFQLTGNGSVSVDVPIPGAGFERAFTVGAFSGKIALGFIISVEGDITGTTVQPHVQVSDTVNMGASVSTSSGFRFQYAGAGHFDGGVKVVDLGDLGVKLSVGPKFEVKLDFGSGKGFDLGAGADGFEEAKINLSGLLGLENWHYHVDAGTEAVLEGSVNVPLLGVNLGGMETFPGPGINLLDAWGTGDLAVSSTTTGKDIFPGQIYQTTVARSGPTEPPPWSMVLSSALGVNDNHLFVGGLLCHQFFQGAPLIPPFIEAPQDCDVVATAHTVSLTGWAWNCNAAEALPVQVTVRPRNPFDFLARLTSLNLGVVCRSAYAVVRDRVAALLAVGAINIGGIATALDAKLTAAETARDAGNVAAADSAIQDLMNQLRAQNGKHITTAADAELQAFATLLRACYETVVPTCSTVPAPTPVAQRREG
jgi:hypothetical protein